MQRAQGSNNIQVGRNFKIIRNLKPKGSYGRRIMRLQVLQVALLVAISLLVVFEISHRRLLEKEVEELRYTAQRAAVMLEVDFGKEKKEEP